MAVKIRLTRRGAKKRPCYKVVVSDARSPRDGRFIEIIGSYNPLLSDTDPARVVIEVDKAKKWLASGAQPTDVVAKLFKKLSIAQ
jgi:small subunit ribosomal protein S16